MCGHTQSVTVTFYAVDAAGNQSLSTTAKFYTEDNQPPTINSVPNVAYSCQVGIRDTLIQWIRNKGGYTATDACSDSVRWTRFYIVYLIITFRYKVDRDSLKVVRTCYS